MRRVLPHLLALASLALLGWLLRGHLGELERLRSVSVGSLVGIALLYGVGRSLGGIVTRTGLLALGHAVPLGVCIMLALLSSYTNLVVPRTGLAPATVYLRHRYAVPIAAYLSLAVVALLIATVLSGLGGLLLWWALGVGSGGGGRPEILLAFALLTGVALLGLIAPERLFEYLPRLVREPLTRAHEAWVGLARRPSVLLRIFSVQLCALLARGWRAYLVFQAIGADVSMGEALLIALCADLGMLISITPGAIGFREGGVLLGAALVGVDPGLALVAAVVDRLVTTAVIITTGQVVVWWGLRDYWSELRRPMSERGSD